MIPLSSIMLMILFPVQCTLKAGTFTVVKYCIDYSNINICITCIYI